MLARGPVAGVRYDDRVARDSAHLAVGQGHFALGQTGGGKHATAAVKAGCRVIRPTSVRSDDLGSVHIDVLARQTSGGDLSGRAGGKFVDALVWVFYPVFLYQRA